MESASLALPTVNIGMRQQGRERARNVLDATAKVDPILEAVLKAKSPAFRNSLKEMSNPYGDGHASERIVQALTSVPLGKKLLVKRAVSPGAEERESR